MYLLRCFVLLAWGAAFRSSLAVPVGPSTSDSGASSSAARTVTSQPQLSTQDDARRVNSNGGHPLINPGTGAAVVGTGLISSLLTANILNRGHRRKMKTAINQRVDKSYVYWLWTLLMRECYPDAVNRREAYLGRELDNREQGVLWNGCLSKYDIPKDSTWIWNSKSAQRHERLRLEDKEDGRPSASSKWPRGDLRLDELLEDTTLPMMTDLGRNLGLAAGAIQRSAPGMLKAAAANIPAAARAAAMP